MVYYELWIKPSAVKELEALQIQDRRRIVTVVKIGHRRDVHR